jgi:tRNA-uridine 2-sulfurtransferase
MSGGVDSSVAAALLVEQGHKVIGVTMKTFCYSENAGPTRTCCGLDGIMDARRVADAIGIPHYVFDMEEAFTAAVIDDFVSEYVAGRTPNPCVRCNSNTKIPDLLRRGRLMGADAIATGHYARIVNGQIARGRDGNKDQSYFLWGVPREVATYLRFPVGDLTKDEVRERARALGLVTAEKPEVRAMAAELTLPTAQKPESQEICFVPTGHYADFLAKRIGTEHKALSPGKVVTATGEVVGEHAGYSRYTVGQRKGLGGGYRRPLYVLGVRPESNEVVVGSEDELLRAEVTISDLNWLGEKPEVGEAVLVQLRYRARAVPAEVMDVSSDVIALSLKEPQRAVTPGQSGVVYRGDVVAGGGRIAA